MQKFLFCFFLGIANFCFAWTLYPGTYSLSGVTAEGSPYDGEVVIRRQGSNYHVEWFTGGRSLQSGVGIFDTHESVLSVAFADPSNIHGWGVASYRVNFWGDLEGKWAFHNSPTSGADHLVWKNSYTY